jgi:hypothetical protein
MGGSIPSLGSRALGGARIEGKEMSQKDWTNEEVAREFRATLERFAHRVGDFLTVGQLVTASRLIFLSKEQAEAALEIGQRELWWAIEKDQQVRIVRRLV